MYVRYGRQNAGSKIPVFPVASARGRSLGRSSPQPVPCPTCPQSTRAVEPTRSPTTPAVGHGLGGRARLSALHIAPLHGAPITSPAMSAKTPATMPAVVSDEHHRYARNRLEGSCALTQSSSESEALEEQVEGLDHPANAGTVLQHRTQIVYSQRGGVPRPKPLFDAWLQIHEDVRESSTKSSSRTAQWNS